MFPITQDDNLRITTFGSATGVVVTLSGVIERPDHTLDLFAFDHAPNSDRTLKTTLHHLGDGRLYHIQARASIGSPRIGQVFVRGEIVRGLSGAVHSIGTLVQGYVTDTAGLAYPYGLVRSSLESRGVLRSITGTDPAAGVVFSETVPTNARWRLLSLFVDFVTSAVVATREVSITCDDGANIYTRVAPGQNQLASLTRRYCAAPIGATPPFATSPSIVIPLPPLELQGGHRIAAVVTNLDAGDDFSAPQLLVEEWIED